MGTAGGLIPSFPPAARRAVGAIDRASATVSPGDDAPAGIAGAGLPSGAPGARVAPLPGRLGRRRDAGRGVGDAAQGRHAPHREPGEQLCGIAPLHAYTWCTSGTRKSVTR
ncbi:hypothetical protein V5799_034173 [Amblyomma americanum]|uniref:Uncharacterized protein n=1 Tax=Amblyomma americanum TaxID=6943 RepID=A0AAQ4DL71_AMBAM